MSFKDNNNKNKKKVRFTIIDLLILVLIISTILGVKYKFSKANAVTPFVAKPDRIRISFFIEETPDFAAKAIKIGDPVRESIQNSFFGNVTDIVIGDSISWSRDMNGNLVATDREGYSSLSITMEASGFIGENGVTIDKSIYYIGQTVTLYVGNSVFQNGRISDIQKINQ
ncbi:MAG TPA: DUF4330 domain-containing protein [Clostridiales bacterium]|nr:DUF4330 domain-containing protein [Clostridiales bacterium]